MFAIVLSLLLISFAVIFTPLANIFAQGGSSLYLPLTNSGPDASIIPNQYIVVLESSGVTSASPAAISAVDAANALVSAYGGEVLQTYDVALYGFAAVLSPEAMHAMEADPAVAYIEPNRIVTINQASPNLLQTDATWGLDRVDQRILPLNAQYTYTNTGLGVHVYIIDNGIRASHSEFTGRMGNGFTAINDGTGTGSCNISDTRAGHGTHVAGSAGGATYGVAKQVTLHSVRVLDCYGSGSIANVIAGVEWVTNNYVSPAVANMSLGGGASTSLDIAVRNSINAGVTYVVAAGNDNKNACNYSPARISSAITVGATDSSDIRGYYSNFGSCLDLFAPGSSVRSSVHTSDIASALMSGTSMASPHVAGVAALYLQRNPSAQPGEVKAVLLNSASQNVVISAGSCSPNRLLYSLNIQDENIPVDVSTPLPNACATATPTPTSTVPTPTPTATATSTPIPTATPTATHTPQPLTPTATPVTPTPEPEICQELVTSGDFEEDNLAWTQSSSQGFQLVCTKATCGEGMQPYAGDALAWLGGGNSERSRLSQSFTIPADQPAYLSYWYWIESEDSCNHDYAYVQIQIDNSVYTAHRYALCNDTRTGGWVPHSIRMDEYAGKTVRLEFYVATDRTLLSNMFLDDITLRSGEICQEGVVSGASTDIDMQQPLNELFSEPPEMIREVATPVGNVQWRR